jgi:phosphoserine phosphatase
MLPAFIEWKKGKTSLTEFKERVFSYLVYIKDVDHYIEEFWNKNIHKSFGWYQKCQKDDDLVISASPEFLIAPACMRLGIKSFIATKLDTKTGKFLGPNCSGEEKVVRFREIYGNATVEKFYSDSYSDKPMALLAKESFLVTDGKLSPWK